MDTTANSDAQKAEELKLKANEAFKANKFSQAIELYSQAIELNSSNAVYWANRAFAHTKLEEYGSAVQDATKAIEIDPRYSKGYYRRGAAYLAMGKFKEALKDFQQVKKICPNDPDATRKLKECEKAVQKIRFEEAISAGDAERRSVADSIDYHVIEVKPQYAGPRIDGEEITLDFVKAMLDEFKKQKCIHKRYAYQIVLKTLELLRSMPSLVDVDVPNGGHFTVCGDVHGQYFDLVNIFELNGLPSEENPYLFNGDFVDRGSFSVEVILTLFAFKCLYPKAMYLARGNHESKNMNKIYGFEGEVRSKLGEKFVELFAEVFCWLPLAHVINKKVFVVHGGLFSVDGVKLSDIRSIDRFCEPPEEGLMCELLWSDPQPQLGRGPSKRGVALSFGADVTKKFLQENNLDLIVRSHEVKDEGYEIEHDGKLITVFSAPNYCDQMGNKGAFIRFTAPEMKPDIVTFSAVPHPDVKPMAYANNFLRMFQ
ncbi:serine/threonine-protein phosphatase 5 [Panicum miliaceum]|uniref:Serine/threonine-protein phosphatase 5 n=1 Tax=Panicum miliaceum TaxID=4540 RepID=A0A3L6SYM3_PANMI|nr:serine/threonine-protein phosphatase 5 [Panicum miliaceum]